MNILMLQLQTNYDINIFFLLLGICIGMGLVLLAYILSKL